jgi:hypothetical protein
MRAPDLPTNYKLKGAIAAASACPNIFGKLPAFIFFVVLNLVPFTIVEVNYFCHVIFRVRA